MFHQSASPHYSTTTTIDAADLSLQPPKKKRILRLTREQVLSGLDEGAKIAATTSTLVNLSNSGEATMTLPHIAATTTDTSHASVLTGLLSELEDMSALTNCGLTSLSLSIIRCSFASFFLLE